MNPERAAMYNLDRRTRSADIEKTAQTLLTSYDRIHEVMEKLAIEPTDFIPPNGMYDADQVRRDLNYVEDRKKDFEASSLSRFGETQLTNEEVRQLAEILEFEIIKGINVGNWLPFCKAIKTSEYDDIANGVDMVVEFARGDMNNHLGLAVDVSFSHNLKNKFQRIKNEIDAFDGKTNRLGYVRYFESKATGIKGELHDLPRVVTALDLGVMEDLARQKDLKGHATQHEVIIEIENQLNTFVNYADGNNPLAAPALRRAQKFIGIISNQLESQTQLETSEYGKNKKISSAINEGLEIFT